MFTPTMCHMSYVIFHVSHVTCNFFCGQDGGASQWRICYQRGLPCLFQEIIGSTGCHQQIVQSLSIIAFIIWVAVFSRPGLVGAVLQTPLSLIKSSTFFGPRQMCYGRVGSPKQYNLLLPQWAIYLNETLWTIEIKTKKSRIRETPTLLTNADSRTDTILERLRDLSLKKN